MKLFFVVSSAPAEPWGDRLAWAAHHFAPVVFPGHLSCARHRTRGREHTVNKADRVSAPQAVYLGRWVTNTSTTKKKDSKVGTGLQRGTDRVGQELLRGGDI